jgi:hypothetical protein
MTPAGDGSPYDGGVPGRRESGAARRWLVLAAAAGAGAAVWILVALLTLLSARDATRAGVDVLERSRDLLTPEAVADGRGLDVLQEAQEHFDRARDRARSPWLTPLRVLPVLGRQVRSVDALTTAAADVADIGVETLDATDDELTRVPADGAARVGTADRIADAASRAAARLGEVDLGPDRALIGALRDARRRLDERLTDLQGAVSRLHDASRALARFLRGPSNYLVLAANNNEMRMGSGTYLSIGELRLDDGSASVDGMTSSGELGLDEGAVAVGGDLADRWGWLEPERDWRNLASSPIFPPQAELAMRMWRARTGRLVDGVLVLDPVALRELLRATGPVVVDGVEYRADNVLRELYLGQYVGLGDDFDTAARRDRLGAITRAAIARFDEGGWEVGDLAETLRQAALGRHLLVWAADPETQRGWEAAGVAGVLEPDSLMLGVHNRAANKLDQFLRVGADLRRDGDGLRLAVELRNETPADVPPYVAGTFRADAGSAPRLYQGLLVFELPRGLADARVVTGDGGEIAPAVAGPDQGHNVVAVYVEIPPGESRRFVLRARVDTVLDGLRIEPSARVPEIRWTYGGARWTDRRARTIEW